MISTEQAGLSGVPSTIFDCRDDLHAYLIDLRRRLAERRRAREKRDYWLSAIEQVETELAAAVSEDDTEIAEELSAVLAEFKRLLGLAPTLPLERPAALLLVADQPVQSAEPDCVDTPTIIQSAAQAPAPEAEAALDSAGFAVVQVAASEPAAVAELLSPEERALRLATHRAAVADITDRWKPVDSDGLAYPNGELNRPNCFRARALACAVNAVFAAAVGDRLEHAMLPEVRALRDRIELARDYANDRAACLPFDSDAWRSDPLRLAADEWEELCGRYERMAVAQDAWEWYERHHAELAQADRLGLLNAVAAVQQALYRTLEDFGGGDRLQSELYGGLREAAKVTGYLGSLNAETPFDELEDLGACLEHTLGAATRSAADHQARSAKEARKQEALAAIDAFCKRQSDLGQSPAAVTQHREALLPLLDACIDAGVPPTNASVRNALLEGGSRLLEGLPKYSRILDAVIAERARRGMDAVPDDIAEEVAEEPSDAAIDEFTEHVRLFAADQRILILGGVPRQRVCDELKEKLGCADIKWLESKRSDKASKFQNEIKKADILLLLKNFAGHDMSEKGREWIKSVGGNFIFVPSGYGVNQIIHQLYKYASAR
jgi:hypothetical protein